MKMIHPPQKVYIVPIEANCKDRDFVRREVWCSGGWWGVLGRLQALGPELGGYWINCFPLLL